MGKRVCGYRLTEKAIGGWVRHCGNKPRKKGLCNLHFNKHIEFLKAEIELAQEELDSLLEVEKK